MFNTVIRKWNLPRRWIDEENMEHTHNVILSNPKIWSHWLHLQEMGRNGIQLEIIILNKVSQIRKDKYVFSYMKILGIYVCIYIVIVMKTQMEQ